MIKQHITSTQVWLFILSTSLGFLVFCSQTAGRAGLLLGLLVSLFFHTLFFIWGDGLLLRRFKLLPLSGKDPWGINQQVKSLTVDSPIRLSSGAQVYILEDDLPTAFSLEIPLKKPMIVLTQALIKKMTPEEIEMAIIHQVCQLQYRQSLKFGVLSLLANTAAQLGLFLDRLWIPNSIFNRKQKPFLSLFSPLISILVRLSHSVQDLYTIDQHAAQLIGSREKLGKLIWKLEGWALTRPMELLPATSHLFIVNPERIKIKNNLLQFHPTVKDRLEKLVGSFPV
jgi:heat shock protein HtpX